MLKIRSRYDEYSDDGTFVSGESRTQQHLKDSVDINSIMERYRITGHLEQQPGGRYIDVSNIGDLRESLELIAEIEEKFMMLPASMRKAVNNDWLELYDLTNSEQGLAALKAAGFTVAAEATPVTPLDVTGVGDTSGVAKEVLEGEK